jgi:hypothetical protein
VQKYGTARQATDVNTAQGARAMRLLINKATDTHSKYVILTGFQRQKLLCESALMLRYPTLPVLFGGSYGRARWTIKLFHCDVSAILVLKGDQKVSVHLMITVQKQSKIV